MSGTFIQKINLEVLFNKYANSLNKKRAWGLKLRGIFNRKSPGEMHKGRCTFQMECPWNLTARYFFLFYPAFVLRQVYRGPLVQIDWHMENLYMGVPLYKLTDTWKICTGGLLYKLIDTWQIYTGGGGGCT